MRLDWGAVDRWWVDLAGSVDRGSGSRVDRGSVHWDGSLLGAGAGVDWDLAAAVDGSRVRLDWSVDRSWRSTVGTTLDGRDSDNARGERSGDESVTHFESVF